MNSITTSFRAILCKQRELGYHFPNIVRTPATLEDIGQTEEALHLAFNEELKELYQFADGSNIDQVTPSGLTGLIPIHNFLSLQDAVTYYRQSMKFENSFYNHEQDFAPGKQLFPFLEDGAGNCYWVDLNEGFLNYGRIYWTNTFGREPDYTYRSLTSMFEVIAEAHETGIISLDEEGYLDCDFKAFDKLSEGR
ncbi:SMI1/KNR4 family protein [Mucilaginibacter robiniae]|uniref:SMI1/KNR4 family protein n=1 Tax=Mucilaginibacter robiniae TaxID=2728022 RepID=A0A7L5E3Y2_9SPHI|nr:SMI1/KNR4 family protein [Mucilaginibacter robiniae]QJD97318.1 SMI1/KNR4 family protein [Mucilaginibacter robiniae]